MYVKADSGLMGKLQAPLIESNYGLYIWFNSFTATGDNNYAFANSIDPDETAQWAISFGSMLFDILSSNFTYKCLSKR